MKTACNWIWKELQLAIAEHELVVCWAPRWARKSLGPDKEPLGKATSSVTNDWEETSAAYSPVTLKSLDLVDENLLNYDLLEALVIYVVETQSKYGPGALLQV